MIASPDQTTSSETFQRGHLLGLENLSAGEISSLLDRAADFKQQAEAGLVKHQQLTGVTIGNLFFENSTRTRTSFSLAAKRLAADTVDFTSSGSSLSKGETFVDTAKNIESMGVELMVVRHSTPGAPHLLSRHVSSGVLNAGDGQHEHPTQALLDLFTIREQKGRIEGLCVALVGDILHSRVARSNIWGLQTLGAKVIACGPSTLLPKDLSELGVEMSSDLADVLPRADCVNMLRIQAERQRSAFFPTLREYAHLFGLDGERMKAARSDVLILAPGPINRGVEITPEVADGPHSVILNQVTNGVFIRMACLSLLHEFRQNEGSG